MISPVPSRSCRPSRPIRATRAASRRRRTRRPVLVLAARSRRSRGARVPRGGERVHRRACSRTSRRCATSCTTEIVGRVQETDASAPVRTAPYEYFTRTIEGQQYDVHCRRPRGTPGLPDPSRRAGNARRRGGRARRERARRRPRLLRRRRPRDRARATTSSRTRSTRRRRALRAPVPRRGATAPTSPTSCPTCTTALAWANDDRTVLFIRPDDAMRPWQVWRHTIGPSANDDVLVYQEDDDASTSCRSSGRAAAACS